MPVDAPWDAARATEYDAQSLEDWLRRNTLDTARFRGARAALGAVFGAELREVSLLFALFLIAASGDEGTPGTFERNFNTCHGAQQDRIAGGTQAIAQAVARQLGRRVVRRSPVRRIVRGRGYVDVVCDRYVNRARRVIVALLPTLAGEIDYAPRLPALRGADAAPTPRPDHQGAGDLRASVLARRRAERIVGHDGRPVRDHVRQLPVLGGFARAFGESARSPIDYVEMDWTAEPFTRGCPLAVPGPGVLTGYGRALREPVGRIHWAGTETATYWHGYKDGAIRAGERAAREALARL